MHINFTTDTKVNKIIISLHELISVIYQQSNDLHLWPVTCDMYSVHLALGSSVHQTKIYPVDNAIVSLIYLFNLLIYPVDNTIQRLNNRGPSNFMFHLNFYQISWIYSMT